jgi:hypothetical protein
MADDRRRRFAQIERPRAPGAGPPDASPGTDGRFGALEEPAATPAPRAAPATPAAGPLDGPAAGSVARGHTDRFRPAAERPLEVDDRAPASQPFVRCARCETDSSRYAARCSTCGEPLDTDEQRAFNERLWAGRRAQAEAEAVDQAAREAALEQARRDEAAARRALAEGMAREVGDRERRRLEGEVYGEPTFGPTGSGERWGEGRWGGPSGDPYGPRLPVGFRLLAALPKGWGVAAGVGALALIALLFLVHTTAGLLAALALASLFTPGHWRRRLRRW